LKCFAHFPSALCTLDLRSRACVCAFVKHCVLAGHCGSLTCSRGTARAAQLTPGSAEAPIAVHVCASAVPPLSATEPPFCLCVCLLFCVRSCAIPGLAPHLGSWDGSGRATAAEPASRQEAEDGASNAFPADTVRVERLQEGSRCAKRACKSGSSSATCLGDRMPSYEETCRCRAVLLPEAHAEVREASHEASATWAAGGHDRGSVQSRFCSGEGERVSLAGSAHAAPSAGRRSRKLYVRCTEVVAARLKRRVGTANLWATLGPSKDSLTQRRHTCSQAGREVRTQPQRAKVRQPSVPPFLETSLAAVGALACGCRLACRWQPAAERTDVGETAVAAGVLGRCFPFGWPLGPRACSLSVRRPVPPVRRVRFGAAGDAQLQTDGGWHLKGRRGLRQGRRRHLRNNTENCPAGLRLPVVGSQEKSDRGGFCNIVCEPGALVGSCSSALCPSCFFGQCRCTSSAAHSEGSFLRALREEAGECGLAILPPVRWKAFVNHACVSFIHQCTAGPAETWHGSAYKRCKRKRSKRGSRACVSFVHQCVDM
jgi:hypothetical protein